MTERNGARSSELSAAGVRRPGSRLIPSPAPQRAAGEADRDQTVQEQQPLRRPELRRPGLVVQLQRLAGNRAVASALASQPGGKRQPGSAQQPATVQRQETTSVAVQPVDLLRTQLAWLDGVVRAADDACVEAQLVSNVMQSPYQDRLRMLIDEVVDSRNWIDGQRAALAGSLADPDQAPSHSPHLHAEAIAVWNRAHVLFRVSDAWRAVFASELLQLLASVGEAQLKRAHDLRQELLDCYAELHRLQRIAEGAGMASAFAKLGVNAAITAISVAYPPVGVAYAIGTLAYEAGKLGVDYYLGSEDGPSAWPLAPAGATVAGAALEGFAGDRQLLATAGKRLGVAGTVAGHLSDVHGTAEAVREYEQAVVGLMDLGQRMERLSRELATLERLLRYPGMARQVIAGLRGHAAALRAEGQVIMQDAGQL